MYTGVDKYTANCKVCHADNATTQILEGGGSLPNKSSLPPYRIINGTALRARVVLSKFCTNVEETAGTCRDCSGTQRWVFWSQVEYKIVCFILPMLLQNVVFLLKRFGIRTLIVKVAAQTEM